MATSYRYGFEALDTIAHCQKLGFFTKEEAIPNFFTKGEAIPNFFTKREAKPG